MSEQKLHADSQTTLSDTDYFFLGSGKIMAAIQWSRNPQATPLGVILSRPEHFARKSGSHLFHPELGLERTMITVIIDGLRYKATHDHLAVEWDDYEGVPSVFASWQAGDCKVQESFHTCDGTGSLIRWVNVIGAGGRKVEIEMGLYANPSLFSSFGSERNFLYAHGYDSIYLAGKQQVTLDERYIRVIPEPFEGDGTEAHLIYTIGNETAVDLQKGFETERVYWEKTSQVKSESHKKIAELFKAAKIGLRAAIASNGSFDASIWQYGMQWGRDAAMVAEGLTYSGQFELAKSVLENILTKLSNDEGMVAEASRFRGGADSELDSNGLVLRALHIYYEWTGDESFIKEHWQRISAIADYLLLPEFLDEETGMLKASRDTWERNTAMGIKFGFDIAHQTFGIIGLQAASSLAHILHDKEKNTQWKKTSERMSMSFLSHKTYALIAGNKIIKRRLPDGSIQRELSIERKKENEDFFAKFLPKDMPLDKTGKHLLEPDITQCFPIIDHLVDPKSEIACNTMENLEKLWSQAWDGGGYGRYDISGEPDSPGPWALATCFMAQSYFEMGEIEKAMRAVEWLIEKAGSGGSWVEFYGDRPTPPLPPTGMLIWAWAQFITLVVKNILGATVENDKLNLSPRIEGFEASLRFRDE
jgi:hypothetical protein